MLSKVLLFSALVLCAYAQEEPHPAPEPYSFTYESPNEDGSSSARQEVGDADGRITGFYIIKGLDGQDRRVDYYADETGFHAEVSTSELGTTSHEAAEALYKSSAPALEDQIALWESSGAAAAAAARRASAAGSASLTTSTSSFNSGASGVGLNAGGARGSFSASRTSSFGSSGIGGIGGTLIQAAPAAAGLSTLQTQNFRTQNVQTIPASTIEISGGGLTGSQVSGGLTGSGLQTVSRTVTAGGQAGLDGYVLVPASTAQSAGIRGQTVNIDSLQGLNVLPGGSTSSTTRVSGQRFVTSSGNLNGLAGATYVDTQPQASTYRFVTLRRFNQK